MIKAYKGNIKAYKGLERLLSLFPFHAFSCRSYTADLVFAWLRYLYTQDDLELTWPLTDAEAEAWWMQLLRLAQHVGDWKLQIYAQVGGSLPHNTTQSMG